MERQTAWLTKWFFYITVGSLFAATVSRSLLLYRQDPLLIQILLYLAVWLILFGIQPIISRRWAWFFLIYLILQTILVIPLLFMPNSPDYFAVLFAILSMQIMERFEPKHGVLLIGLFTPLMAYPWVRLYGLSESLAFALIYTGVNALMGSYTWATQRAQSIRKQNINLAQYVRETNQQLRTISNRLEELAVARERHHMARELHDSVTQTIFSITLTTQSALLLIDNEPDKVSALLSRLNDLAQRALAEMHTLVTKLRPQEVLDGGLVSALRQHLANRHLPENLSVSLEVEGDQNLEAAEEQNLYRIIQEAMNNVIKHSQAPIAFVRIHLCKPLWVEVEDQGVGFDLEDAHQSGGNGLVNMRERAVEIGWDLQVMTLPGAGTRLRVEKKSERGHL